LHIFYLHGFASSARSSKAAMFKAKLEERGVPLHIPDFNEPDFSTLTISRMVGQVRNAIESLDRGRAPVALIGSSLGGFVAVQTAVAMPDRIAKLVLLAPALDFDGNRLRNLGDRGVDEWRRTNRLEVFHHGFGRLMPVHFQLYTDAQGYDALDARVEMPIQIFQGRNDTAVDPAMVERWARARPNARLHLLDDDHQLTASFEYIWTESSRFLFK